MSGFYSSSDEARVEEIHANPEFPLEPYRTPWRRDCARLLHSPSFRRLQGKQQLFPGIETDFFRNRLTHSLEVAQIAKSIAIKLNHDFEESGEAFRIEPDVAEFAGLAHDLGHPPFGHFGEKVLDDMMRHWGGFEGNAQALRVLAKLEKRHLIPDTVLGIDKATGTDKRVGLNLTFRSLASVLKYDREIPSGAEQQREEVVKGYYRTEADLVGRIKEHVAPGVSGRTFKTIECQIMDLADDIAYSTYDLEDSFKAGFIRPIDLVCASDDILQMISQKLQDRIGTELEPDGIRERIHKVFFNVFKSPVSIPEDVDIRLDNEIVQGLHLLSLDHAHKTSCGLASNGYQRTNFTSKLIGRAVRNVKVPQIDRQVPALSTVVIEEDVCADVEILKNFVYQSQILSPKIQIFARRSREIIETIFDTLNRNDGHLLLPDDFRTIYEALKSETDRKRAICDFMAGMTDSYAVEFYGRLRATNPQTIFKPMA